MHNLNVLWLYYHANLRAGLEMAIILNEQLIAAVYTHHNIIEVQDSTLAVNWALLRLDMT